MTEQQTVIAIDYEDSGAPTHRIVAAPDYDAEAENLFDSPASIRVVAAPDNTSYDYYERNRFGDAWDAYDRFAAAFMGKEAVDAFERYMRIYRPFVPVYRSTLRTGYSQGDWVELIGWDESSAGRPPGSEPAFVRSARLYASLVQQFNVIAAIARKQLWRLSWEHAEVQIVDYDKTRNVARVEVEWVEDDSYGGQLCMTEFDPWPELREIADDLFLPESSSTRRPEVVAL